MERQKKFYKKNQKPKTMKRSKETFMEHREQEMQMENSLPTNWVEPIPHTWLNQEPEKKKLGRKEEPDDPIAEHDEQEFNIVEEHNKNFEQDNPRE